MSKPCVFQDWILDLTMQQQSVLVIACRGPDGVGKFHPMKTLVCYYRATVFKAAYLGRPMRPDEGDNTTFMHLRHFTDDEHFGVHLREYFRYVDQLPHHFHLHLMHGAQIAGYKHPDQLFRSRWGTFYLNCCDDMHVAPEMEEDMDHRLSDWDRKYWDVEP